MEYLGQAVELFNRIEQDLAAGCDLGPAAGPARCAARVTRELRWPRPGACSSQIRHQRAAHGGASRGFCPVNC